MGQLWRRRSVLAAGIVGVAAAGVAAGAPRIAWPPAATSAAPAGLPLAAATISRQTLIDVRSVPGRLAYGLEQKVESPLEGIVTWLPDLGAIIERGKVLLRIDDLPVVLLYGALPAYRELAVGAKGNDVKQFEENLKALGHGKAVREWHKALGLEQTGVVELGRVFYAGGPVRVASYDLAVGQKVSAPVLTYTATARMVTAGLKPHEQELAKKGAEVTIALPNGNEAAGKVESARTTQEKGDSEQVPGLEVQVSLVDPQVDCSVGSPATASGSARAAVKPRPSHSSVSPSPPATPPLGPPRVPALHGLPPWVASNSAVSPGPRSTCPASRTRTATATNRTIPEHAPLAST